MTNNFYLFYFIALNVLIFFNYKRISKVLNIYDTPNDRKLHKKNTPLLGGIIIFINLVFFSFFYFLDVFKYEKFLYFFLNNQFLIFFLSTFLIFLLGSVDDKYNLKPNIKLFLLSVIISLTLFFDNSLIIDNLIFSFIDNNLSLGKYSFIFTLICFLLYINACNMYDGTNLQSSSYFLILLFYLMIIGVSNGFLNVLLILLILIFILNKSGKIFMGDSGIYTMSFIFAYILVKLYNFDNKLSADLIFILMMLPGVDMFRLFISRILSKKNPFSADRQHIHHLLLNKFSSLKTLIILNISILYPIILTLAKFPKFFIILIFLFQYLSLILYLKKNNYK